MKTINSIFTLAMVLFCLTFGASYANAGTMDGTTGHKCICECKRARIIGDLIGIRSLIKAEIDQMLHDGTQEEPDMAIVIKDYKKMLQLVDDACNPKILSNQQKREKILEELATIAVSYGYTLGALFRGVTSEYAMLAFDKIVEYK